MSQLNFDDLFSVFQGEPSTVGAVVASEPAKMSAPKKMITSDNARREFIRVIGLTARYLRRWDVFCDFITLVASELDIETVRTADNIERSRKICARYEAADLENLHTLFGMLVCALQGKYQDFLGSVFMELDLGSDDMGQFFTPYGPMLTVMSNKDSLNHNVILIFIYNSSDTEYNAMAKCIRSVLTGTTMQCRLGCLNTLIVSWDII